MEEDVCKNCFSDCGICQNSKIRKQLEENNFDSDDDND